MPVGRGPPRSASFIALFALDSLARSTVVTIVPLQAYALLGDPRSYLLAYFSISATALVCSMAVPWLVRRINHFGTMVLGSCCMVLSAILLSGHALQWFVPGLVLQLFSAATIAICLNLYVLKNVPRSEFTRFEPTRIVFAGGAWVVGPAMGVYIGQYAGETVPYLVAATISLIQLVYFLSLRLQEPRGQTGGVVRRASPVRFVVRYFKQPRLVLAWLLSVTRAGWWGLFYSITPVYLVANGIDDKTIGLITSIGSAGMLTVLFWGWVGRKVGIRALFVPAYAVAGALTVLVAATSGYPLAGACLLIAAAAATSVIDSCGNVAYLGAVRPRERSEMTTVYATYRDISRVTSQGVYTLLLEVFPFMAIFMVGGGIMIMLSQCARKLPRSLGLERNRRAGLKASKV